MSGWLNWRISRGVHYQVLNGLLDGSLNGLSTGLLNGHLKLCHVMLFNDPSVQYL